MCVLLAGFQFHNCPGMSLSWFVMKESLFEHDRWLIEGNAKLKMSGNYLPASVFFFFFLQSTAFSVQVIYSTVIQLWYSYIFIIQLYIVQFLVLFYVYLCSHNHISPQQQLIPFLFLFDSFGVLGVALFFFLSRTPVLIFVYELRAVCEALDAVCTIQFQVKPQTMLLSFWYFSLFW